jgi:hypothetical protein
MQPRGIDGAAVTQLIDQHPLLLLQCPRRSGKTHFMSELCNARGDHTWVYCALSESYARDFERTLHRPVRCFSDPGMVASAESAMPGATMLLLDEALFYSATKLARVMTEIQASRILVMTSRHPHGDQLLEAFRTSGFTILDAPAVLL